jgi:hypothetical protein
MAPSRKVHSPKMLALLQKLDAADVKHFDDLRESAKQDKRVKAEAKARADVRSANARVVAKKAFTAREPKPKTKKKKKK